MSRSLDLSVAMENWPYDPGFISSRRTQADDGREILQLRVDMGILQLEPTGRPDGTRPHGFDNCLNWLAHESAQQGSQFRLTPEQCSALDREFVQYYHRRVCWMALREFQRAVEDADHTLAMMDFVVAYSPNADWTSAHEQYRTFVLYHRTQAAALAPLQGGGPEQAGDVLDKGIEQITAVLREMGAEEMADQDPQLTQLQRLKEWLRKEYHLGPTLVEQLSDAIAAEDYERAARLRDEIALRAPMGRTPPASS